MKMSPAEQESIVALLTRIYDDLVDVETRFKLLIGDGDFRPRIEYFHDAIRAFTSGDHTARESGGRLCVEYLAYDLSCLRYLQSMPLAPFKPHAANLSPTTEVVRLDQQLAPSAIRPDRVEKERIAELYQRYAVLFAALLKPLADKDYHDRTDDLNHDIRDMNTITQQCEGGKPNEYQIAAAIENINDPQLRAELITLLRNQKFKKREDLLKIAQALKEKSKSKDKEIAGIETAHLNYAMSQLAIYEESKDMVKKLAQQGMNLVGQFVESSIVQTKREMGR